MLLAHLFLATTLWVGITVMIIRLTLQVRKLGLRDAKWLVQNHQLIKGQIHTSSCTQYTESPDGSPHPPPLRAPGGPQRRGPDPILLLSAKHLCLPAPL